MINFWHLEFVNGKNRQSWVWYGFRMALVWVSYIRFSGFFQSVKVNGSVALTRFLLVAKNWQQSGDSLGFLLYRKRSLL